MPVSLADRKRRALSERALVPNTPAFRRGFMDIPNLYLIALKLFLKPVQMVGIRWKKTPNHLLRRFGTSGTTKSCTLSNRML